MKSPEKNPQPIDPETFETHSDVPDSRLEDPNDLVKYAASKRLPEKGVQILQEIRRDYAEGYETLKVKIYEEKIDDPIDIAREIVQALSGLKNEDTVNNRRIDNWIQELS